MAKTISKEREALFDKLYSLYNEVDAVRKYYWTEEHYNNEIRNSADHLQTYISAVKDMKHQLTTEWIKDAIKFIESREKYINDKTKQGEVN